MISFDCNSCLSQAAGSEGRYTMPKLAANLSMMFTEIPFMERFAAARRQGFKGVEYLFPYDWPAADLARALEDNGLVQVLFNLSPGDWDEGERGLAALPGREGEFRASVIQALDYAKVLGCRQLHVMAGLVGAGSDRAVMEDVYVGNLKYAAAACADAGVRLLIEPINDTDMPGYFLNFSNQAGRIIERVASNNLYLQFDVYHMQIMEGHLAHSLGRLMPLIRHMQIASVPGRREPDEGEVDYDWLLRHVDELGYDGWIGCEYRPRGATNEGLGWGVPWGLNASSA